ncbi:MAG: SAM-dependent methyltransferase [Clostridia bacterium]|nr:SAM-dependent methyltransferase [Clostridia bacterium]
MPTLPANKNAAPRGTVRLSERLFAIAESLPRGGVICDVGSDHGLLPLYLVQNGYCERVLVSDLNAAPLERAKQNFARAGKSRQAEFFLTDGIEELAVYRPDAFVIAGMGGETIAGILSRSKGFLAADSFFALQPMTRTAFLRRWLYHNGFRVEKESVVAENGKTFVLLFAVFDGVIRHLSEKTDPFGEFLPHIKSESCRLYFEKLRARYRARAEGKRRAGQSAAEEEQLEEKCRSILEKYDENS